MRGHAGHSSRRFRCAPFFPSLGSGGGGESLLVDMTVVFTIDFPEPLSFEEVLALKEDWAPKTHSDYSSSLQEVIGEAFRSKVATSG